MPGRVNLIGEHIDYHNLPVLPMAIQRQVGMNYEAVASPCVHVESAGFGLREVAFEKRASQVVLGSSGVANAGPPRHALPAFTEDADTPSPAGDWANYLKAAIRAVQTKWSISRGFRAQVTSDLPPAAGLSSSSALLAAFTLGLLRANGIEATLEELMSLLPEGEHFVGTRGGGMDHAAVLASRAGHASLIRFAPFSIEHVSVPAGWHFLVAHSLRQAEKSGAAKARYNACRAAGLLALSKLGLAGFDAADGADTALLAADERAAFLHVTGEAERVRRAVAAMRSGHAGSFGCLLNASHASLRDLLRVSTPELDRIVEVAVAAGADGARLTGAGFGGCAIILCREANQAGIMAALEREFYSAYSEYDRSEHLIPVQPSNGALYAGD